MAIDTIKSTAVLDGAIATADIADDAVTSAKLDTNIAIDGKLGIGDSTVLGNKVHIRTGGSATSVNASAGLVLEDDDNTRCDLQFMGPNGAFHSILFGDVSDDDIGRISYSHSGNNMRFTVNAAERMRIDSSGRVSIGTTVAHTADSLLTLQNSGGSAELNITSGTSGGSVLNMGDTGDFNIGRIKYDQSTNSMQFNTNNAERMRINSSGTVMVGRTATGYSNTGAQFTASGAQNIFVANGDYALGLGRNSSDGIIQEFRKDGTTVGSIGTGSGYLTIGNGDTGLLFNDDTNRIQPWNLTGNTSTDASIDIGLSSQRFKDLYLSGGVYLGGTGSANHLHDYEEGTWTPTIGGNATYYNRAGYYIKIGQLVFITGICHVNAVGTGATNNFQGLPFGGATGTGREAFIGVQFFNNLNVSATYFALRANGAQLYGSMQGGADGVMSINPAFITAATEVAFAGSYYTTG